MKYLFNLIRSCLFFVVYSITYIFLGATLMAPIILKNEKWAGKIAIIWNQLIIWLLKIICGVKYKVEGLENLPDNNTNYVIVSKHQSSWETYFYLYFFKNVVNRCVVFVLKKELLKIPIFGWGLKACGNIAIDRNMGISSLKQTVKEAKYRILEQKRNLVIFPQGTRTPIGSTTEEYPYKVGFLAIIKELNVDILPIAINTGKFWAKGQFIKSPGKVIIKLLPVIKAEEISSMKKQDVMLNIENLIEEESRKLL